LRGAPFSLRCPDAVKDYLHVEDVGRALALLATVPTEGLFEVGTGVPVTVGTIARSLADTIERRDLLVLGNEPDALGDMVADAECIRSIGWSPTVPLAEGLAAMVVQATREAQR
jgi:GDP-L-fucose synthase